MKILEGKLISKKVKDTYVVEVSRVRPHPLYKKLVRLSKKYKVDNAGFEDLELGTKVRIKETKPMSKDKYFKISDVVTNETKKTVKKSVNKRKEKSSSKGTKKTK
jgi:small subunit ribosomal protein S17